MNVAELFFKSCTYQPLAKWCFFPILSCTKKNLAVANVFETVPTSAKLKKFRFTFDYKLANISEISWKLNSNFFKESKMLFFTFRLTIAISNHFSKIIRTLKYHMSNSCQNWSTTCHKFFFKGFGVPSPICRH